MRRIDNRGSNPCANYHFKHWIALESSSDVYKETFRETIPLKNRYHSPYAQPPITLQAQRESNGPNGMKEPTAMMEAQDRG